MVARPQFSNQIPVICAQFRLRTYIAFRLKSLPIVAFDRGFGILSALLRSGRSWSTVRSMYGACAGGAGPAAAAGDGGRCASPRAPSS